VENLVLGDITRCAAFTRLDLDKLKKQVVKQVVLQVIGQVDAVFKAYESDGGKDQK
jgi:hypothetical protein